MTSSRFDLLYGLDGIRFNRRQNCAFSRMSDAMGNVILAGTEVNIRKLATM